MSAMNSFSVDTSWPIDFCGAVLTVASFTDEIYFPLTQRWKERSRMKQYRRLMWGINAGETLIMVVILLLIVLCMTMFSKPFCTSV